MKKATKIILGSALTMALSASLIVGSTLALFSSDDKVEVVISSGEISVDATVEQSSFKGLSADGSSSSYAETTVQTGQYTGTFTTGGTYTYAAEQSKLTLSNIAPGDGVEFDLKITNSSTIKIKYRLEVTASDGDGNDLYKALEVYFAGTKADFKSETTFVQQDWTNLEASASPLQDVKVKIKLPITAGDQNTYQKKSCNLTIRVYAVQQNGYVAE